MTEPLPLWCVCPEPNAAVKLAIAKVPAAGQVFILRGLDNTTLHALYALARVFLFPSLAEGFGWPLVEAQACGCPVITTDEPPMNEVAGPAACYLPRFKSLAELETWARGGAILLENLLTESAAEKAQRRELGQSWVSRFDAAKAIEQYLEIYQRILDPTAAQDNARLGQT